MVKSTVRSLSLLSALLLGTAAFTMAGATGAAAKVGVTSATDGDPLGKPPTEPERVLRVGVDVQANEVITTRANDRAHLMFLDGTSLTVGPDAQIVIDKFVYDPNSKTGELAVSASKGVFRLVGGKISKTNAITVTTPSSTIGIRGGIGMFDVNSQQTKAFFIHGISMLISANGQSEKLTRVGTWVLTLFGQSSGSPQMITPGMMTGLVAALESFKGGNKIDADNKSGGFSKANSDKGTKDDGTPAYQKFGSGPGPKDRNVNDTIINALTQSNQAANTPKTTPKPEDVVPIVNTMTSTLTYQGTMTGLVLNDRDFSIKQGTYQNVWSPGTRSGAVTATFDGATFGNGQANTFLTGNNSSNFISTSPIASTSGPARSLSVGGTFTGPSAAPSTTPLVSPTGQTGAFIITGNKYISAGTFNATKK